MDSVIKRYIHNARGVESDASLPDDNAPTFHFKLPIVGHYSAVTQKKIRFLVKRYCRNLNIRLVFSSFKTNNLFNVKDPVPNGLLSRVVYKFVCAGCNASYIGETNRHFSTRVREHLTTDKASHIFKHLSSNHRCKSMSTSQCFKIIDHAETPFQLKIKEALHILWDKPFLNHQVKHVNLKLFL